MPMTIYEIKLLVETDDPAVLDELVSKVAAAACASDPHSDHECPVPWLSSPRRWRMRTTFGSYSTGSADVPILCGRGRRAPA